jgi:hypothetical protein
LHTPSRRTWRIRRSGVYPQPILSPWHARSVAVAAAALLHAAVMLAAGAVFLSCCHCVRATGYGLARTSISEWVDIWRIEGLLTQKLYRKGCMDWSKMEKRELEFSDVSFPKSVAPMRSHQNDTYILYGHFDPSQLEKVAPVKFLTPLIGVSR